MSPERGITLGAITPAAITTTVRHHSVFLSAGFMAVARRDAPSSAHPTWPDRDSERASERQRPVPQRHRLRERVAERVASTRTEIALVQRVAQIELDVPIAGIPEHTGVDHVRRRQLHRTQPSGADRREVVAAQREPEAIAHLILSGQPDLRVWVALLGSELRHVGWQDDARTSAVQECLGRIDYVSRLVADVF